MSQTYHQAVDELNSKLDNIQAEISAIDRSRSGGSSRNEVTDFGATGNGDDETDEIQKAINVIHEEGGGKLHFPPGEYKITEQVFGKENVSLEGAGRYQSIIHQEDADEFAVNLSGASKLNVENLGFTHKHNLQPQEDGQLLFSGKPVENVTVQDCAFIEPARQAVGFWSGDNINIKFRNNDLIKCPRAGVVAFGRAIQIDDNYFNGTGDDAIALNTDNTTDCSASGNMILNAAMVGEQHGRAIKFHGRNTSVDYNVIVNSNQGGIRGQIVDHASGKGTDDPTKRNSIKGNIIHKIVDINPNRTASAAIELREFESAHISNNSIYDVDGLDAFRIRNDGGFETYVKMNDNFVRNADKGIHMRHNTQNFAEFSNNTFIDVNEVIEFEEPVEVCHFFENTGHNIGDVVDFSGVDSGGFHCRMNWFTDVDSSNFFGGSLNGGEVNNFLNVPSGATSRVKNNADYSEVKWSDLT